MPTTSNFGWTTPADTDLVKDGAAAIRTLGNGIDTSFLDLKGGTTDQVLAKNSNTDLDFKWVAQDDSNAIQNALLTTTGDTIYASAASTPARLGVGLTGQVLTVAGGVPTWATPAAAGMNLVTSGSFTAASSFNLGTPFTSTYRNYKVLVSLVNTAANSNPGIYCSPRAGGTNNVSGGVDFTYRFYSSAATTDSTNTNQNNVQLGNFLDDGWSLDMTIYQPNISGKTFARYAGIAGSGGSGTVNGQYEGAFTVQANTQWDSLGFTLSGDTFTGFYRVYGLAD